MILNNRQPLNGFGFGKQGMAQWLECSPPTNVARVQIPVSTPYVGWVWVRFLGKSKSGFPNPKRDFLGKSKNGSWIHKIHTQGGFFRSIPNPDFSDS